jgi:hypothetical protein
VLFNIIITTVWHGNTTQLNTRLVGFTTVISALTVTLSVLTVPFLLGTGIHLFQVGIILAGVAGGPVSGFVTGSIGGLYMAIVRSDPTIAIGNGLLGLCTGIFSRKLRPVFAGLAAWVLIQAPWIYLTGTLILQVPAVTMQLVLVLVTLENLICASIVDVLATHFHIGRTLLGNVRSR